MICTYLPVFLLLFILSDAYQSKRYYDPDILMHNMMTGQSGGDKYQRPSVFGAQWGFLIHNPNSYSQYGEQNYGNSVDNLVDNQATTAIKMNTINADNLKTKKMKNYNMHGISLVDENSAANKNKYVFNPNTLNQQLMHIPHNNNYDRLKDYMQTIVVHQTNQAPKEDIKQKNNTEHIEPSRQGTPAKNKGISNINSMPKDKTEKQIDNESGENSKTTYKAINRFDADQLNKQMMTNMFSPNSLNGNMNGFPKHGSVIRLADNSKQSSRHETFHFDATNLNSKMFHNVGYNPVNVNSATGLDRKHKRSSSDFNPNTIMSKYMELRTNSNSFGSYHPNDLINEITSFSIENENSQTPFKFDPNGHSMFPSTQHTDWGFSIYNPLHSLEQYSGSNNGKGSAGPSQNTDSEEFNPNKLNDHLMEILKQKMTEISKTQDEHVVNGFDPDTLNSKLFQSLGYNPGTVSIKTILPMFHGNVPLPVRTNSENATHRNGLPGIGTSEVFVGTKSSSQSQNGYVKNTHSRYENAGTINLSGVQPEQVTPSTSTNLQNNQGQTQITNSGAGIKNHNLSFGGTNQNSAQGVNTIFNGNIISQTGATNTANVQATGIGSLSGSVETKGNGYHQSMYQQGPTQGIINNTSVLTGTGGLLIQTQAGGLGSTTVQQTGVASGNGKGPGTGNQNANNGQTAVGGLGSTTIHQIGTGSLGTQGTITGNGNVVSTQNSQTAGGSIGSTSVIQTGAGSLGTNTITQTANGNIGGNTATQTNTGGLGSNTVSQTAAGSLGSLTGTGSLGSNTVSQTATGGLGSTSVGQTGSGSTGSNVVTQTNAGGLGSNTVAQSAAGSLGSTSVGKIGSGSLGSNTVAQTNTGGLGSNTVSQTATGSLGSNSATQTNAGGLGPKTVQQTNTGALGYTSVSQTSNGSLGSNSGAQTGAGSLGTKTIQQTNGGSIGSNTVTQTGVGSLGNSGSVVQTAAGSLGSNSVKQTSTGSLGVNNG